MCGLLKGLLGLFRKTGMDSIDALTPAPVGDCSFEQALDAMGDDLLIFPGCFAAFQRPGITAGGIARQLDELYTERIRDRGVVLRCFADGIPTDPERFLAVRDWFDK